MVRTAYPTRLIFANVPILSILPHKALMFLRINLSILIISFICISNGYASFPPYRGPEISSIAISPKNTKVIYAGTGEGIFKSTNRGKSWQFIGKGSHLERGVNSLAIDPLRSDTLYIGGYLEDEGVRKSTDSGRSWKAVNEGLVVSARCISGQESFTPPVNRIVINPIDSKKIIASVNTCSTDNNTYHLFLSNDGGEHWHSVYSNPANNIYSLAFDPKQPESVFAGTNNGLLKSSDGGMTWQEVSISPPLLYQNRPVGFGRLTVTNINKQILYAHALGLMKSEDSGTTWQKIEHACGNFAVAPSAPNVIYMDCNIESGSSVDWNAFSKSTDYGASWQPIGKGLPSTWRARTLAVDPKNPNIVFASWQNGGLFRSMNGGKTWQASDEGLRDTAAHEGTRYLQQPPLHRAVIDHDIKQVRKLLKQGVDVNEVSATGMTPVLWAASHGTAEILNLLISHGAKLDVKDTDDFAPLHLAIRAKNIEIVKILLKHGVDVNQRVVWQSVPLTPLIFSFSSRYSPKPSDMNLVNLLLNHGAKVDDFKLMQEAVESESDKLALVKLLYEKGAHLLDKEHNLMTYAVRECDIDVIKFLLEKGLTFDSTDENRFCNDTLKRAEIKKLKELQKNTPVK